MLNLPMIVTCPISTCSIVASHGASSHRHDTGAWVRPYHVDKPERSSSGSRHAPRTSPHQALSAFIFLRNCSDPTSNGQVSVLQCHPWIGNADTHSTRRIYNRVAITHLLHRMSQKRTYYNKYGLRPSNTITAEGLEDKVSPSTPTA